MIATWYFQKGKPPVRVMTDSVKTFPRENDFKSLIQISGTVFQLVHHRPIFLREFFIKTQALLLFQYTHHIFQFHHNLFIRKIISFEKILVSRMIIECQSGRIKLKTQCDRYCPLFVITNTKADARHVMSKTERSYPFSLFNCFSLGYRD